MESEKPREERAEPPPEVPKEGELPPLVPGRPLTRDESVERMYRRYAKTFEALAK